MTLEGHPAVQRLLRVGGAWQVLEHHTELTSTLDVALARAQQGAGAGLVVVADHQRAGRGRAGRAWRDAPSVDASLLLAAVADAPGGDTPLVPLAAGLAVTDATRSAGVETALKWPNDVLAGGAKCAGVLVERHAIDGRDLVLVGIGIDLDWRGIRREGEAASWTSLAEFADRSLDRGQLLADVLTALADRLSQLRADRTGLLAAYRRRCATIGRDVDVSLPATSALHGRAVEVDGDGRLVVATPDGRVTVDAGDVVHVRPVHPAGG